MLVIMYVEIFRTICDTSDNVCQDLHTLTLVSQVVLKISTYIITSITGHPEDLDIHYH
jgi:hypothetical protein